MEMKMPTKLELLLPRVVAGSLLGIKGQRLVELEMAFGVHILLMGKEQCFEGTNERKCIINGSYGAVCKAAAFVINEVHQVIISGNYHEEHLSQAMQRAKEGRIVIPSRLIAGVELTNETIGGDCEVTCYKPKENWPETMVIAHHDDTQVLIKYCQRLLHFLMFDEEYFLCALFDMAYVPFSGGGKQRCDSKSDYIFDWQSMLKYVFGELIPCIRPVGNGMMLDACKSRMYSQGECITIARDFQILCRYNIDLEMGKEKVVPTLNDKITIERAYHSLLSMGILIPCPNIINGSDSGINGIST